jgi:hypothetical protein
VSHRNHRAIDLLFLRMPLADRPLPRGRSALAVGLSQANDFRQEGLLDEDYEVTRLAITFRQGFGGSEIWAEAAWLHRGPGFMDPIIDFWHRNVFAGTGTARDGIPRFRSVLSEIGRYGAGSRGGLGDLAVGWRFLLPARLTGDVAIELPVGRRRDFLGNGSLDLGFSIQRRFDLGKGWGLHGLLGLAWQGGHPQLRKSRRWVAQQALSLQWVPNRRDAWSLLWTSEGAPSQTNVPTVDAPHRLLTLSYLRRLSARSSLELYFSEDGDLFKGGFPELASTGPDLTVGARLTFRF